MRHSLRMEQWVPFPMNRVFDFFADPRNLPPLMPAWQKARIVAAAIVPPPAPPSGRTPTGHEAGVGSKMTITFRPVPLLPFRLRWEALIEEFAWGRALLRWAAARAIYILAALPLAAGGDARRCQRHGCDGCGYSCVSLRAARRACVSPGRRAAGAGDLRLPANAAAADDGRAVR